MKGYVPVDIPTKRYLCAWVHSKLGDKPVMSETHHIGSKLNDLLHCKRNFRRSEYSSKAYPVTMRVYINKNTYRNKGCNLHETNIIAMNSYMESLFKEHVHFFLDTYVELTESLEASVELLREKFGIDEDEFPYETIKKDYYRYRQKITHKKMPRGGYKKLTRANIHPIL